MNATTQASEGLTEATERPTTTAERPADASEASTTAAERPADATGRAAHSGEQAFDTGEQQGRATLIDEIIAGTGVIAAHQRCAVARRLLRRGISMTHLHVLWILREHGDLSVSRLAEFLDIAVPNATGLVDRMEQRGLVERDRNRADRRLVFVRPTPAGIAAADEMDGWLPDLMVQVLGRLDLDQLERVARGIRDSQTALTAEADPADPATDHAPAHLDGVSTAVPEVITQ